MRSDCLTCGGPLVRYRHWGICPRCEPEFYASITPPTIAEQIHDTVGGLLREKGRPTIGGERK